jgi:hypothetical protein
MGTIPTAAKSLGYEATGSDLIDRSDGEYPVVDFLTDNTKRKSIVMNPPYGKKMAEKFTRHALEVADNVAILVQTKWLNSAGRHTLFTNDHIPSCVYVCPQRPDCPPGEALIEHGESIRGGGSIDYVWVTWERHWITSCSHIRWLPLK